MPRKKIMRASLVRKRKYMTKKAFATVVNTIVADIKRELTPKMLASIRGAVREAWTEIATRKLQAGNPYQSANPRNLPRYMQGMGDIAVDGDKIKIKLRTFDTLRLEYGWAPPPTPGSRLEDGLGKYDGHLHDMRPLLLYSGKPPVQTKRGSFTKKRGDWTKKAKERGVWEIGEYNKRDQAPKGRTGATMMKIIKLELDQMSIDDLSSEVMDWMERQISFDAERKNAEEGAIGKAAERRMRAAIKQAEAAKNVWKNAMNRVIKDVNRRLRLREAWEGNSDDWTLDEKYNVWRKAYDPTKPASAKFKDTYKKLPKSANIQWSEQMGKPVVIKHKSFLFRNLRVEPAPGHTGEATSKTQYQMFTLRTISDSPRQLRRKRWFTVGTPPANIIAGDPQGDDLIHRISALVSEKGLYRALKEKLAKPTKIKVNEKEKTLQFLQSQIPGLQDKRKVAEDMAIKGASPREIRKALGPEGVAALRQELSQPAIAPSAGPLPPIQTPAAKKVRRQEGPSAAYMAKMAALEERQRLRASANVALDPDYNSINDMYEGRKERRYNFENYEDTEVNVRALSILKGD